MSEIPGKNVGGYEDGYRACPCFWGRAPGSMLARLCEVEPDWTNRTVLDAGCGEGKNAVFLARKGARVLAVDVCALAIQNAREAWVDADLVEWRQADVLTMPISVGVFAAVILYGLFHCLANESEVVEAMLRLQGATTPGGYHVMCAFNDRYQDLSAHPGFTPTLLPHSQYLALYQHWDILHATDEDLHETHPNNGIPHVHSLTRVVARKGAAT